MENLLMEADLTAAHGSGRDGRAEPPRTRLHHYKRMQGNARSISRKAASGRDEQNATTARKSYSLRTSP
jgi:hypothetical protein